MRRVNLYWNICFSFLCLFLSAYRAEAQADTSGMYRTVSDMDTDALPFVKTDSLSFNMRKDSVYQKKSHNPLKWIANYLKNTNKEENNKPFDFSVLLGPSYTASTSLGLGATASGLYKWDRNDPDLPKSNVSLFANATLAGMFSIGLRGNNFLPHERYRLNYQMYVYTFPSYFWGIGFDHGMNDALKSKYDRVKFQFRPDFLFRLTSSVYLGPTADVTWIKTSNFENIALIEGQDTKIVNMGLGLNFTYDTRDFVLNAYRGNYLRIEQMAYPDFLGNKYAYGYTDVTYSAYRKFWKTGVVALELHSLFNYGDVPWTSLALVGTPNRMRGYYEGRYRDKNIIEGQLEVRQHIKGRHGAVVWVGFANVFPTFNQLQVRHTLPNGGVGYRWEFKQRVNIRLDFGLTRDGANFSFNINEAF